MKNEPNGQAARQEEGRRKLTPAELRSLEVLGELVGSTSQLSERERMVLGMRFGLLDGRFRSLEVVAREFGVTRERIRQIEYMALSSLAHHSRNDLEVLRALAGWEPPEFNSPSR